MNFSEAIEAAVQLKGEDYIYPAALTEVMCTYTETGPDGRPAPSCLVGHALHLMGIPMEKIIQCEGDDAEAAFDTCGVAVTASEIDAALEAQRIQDEGFSWGQALEAYQAYKDE